MKTRIGELTLHFDKVEELQATIGTLEIDAVGRAIVDKLGDMIVSEPREPKLGAEFAYKFTPQGKVELNRVPSSAPTAIGLLLYAYDPEPVDSEEVFRATGVKSANYVTQIGYKKYFDKTPDGKLILTHPGRIWVQDEVLPGLKKSIVAT